jgi:hypothetical protein
MIITVQNNKEKDQVRYGNNHFQLNIPDDETNLANMKQDEKAKDQ